MEGAGSDHECARRALESTAKSHSRCGKSGEEHQRLTQIHRRHHQQHPRNQRNAAAELFYEEGINTVGIDRVIEHAGVAKASLYNTFGSKDELIRAYLAARHEARKECIQQRLAGMATPKEKILAVFEDQCEVARTKGFRGCAFIRASAELGGEEGIRGVCDESRGWLRGLFADLATQAGAAHPGWRDKPQSASLHPVSRRNQRRLCAPSDHHGPIRLNDKFHRISRLHVEPVLHPQGQGYLPVICHCDSHVEVSPVDRVFVSSEWIHHSDPFDVPAVRHVLGPDLCAPLSYCSRNNCAVPIRKLMHGLDG